MKRILIISLLVALLASSAMAAVPGVMSYQGLLRDGVGNVVPNGNYNLTFRLYNVAAGGAALWTEPQTVAVADGVFNVFLGSVVGFGALTFADQYWLGVQVGGNPELAPRVRLASSPYAFTARHIEPNVISSVDGVINDEGNIDLVAGANVTITPDDAANTITISAAGGGGGIGGSGLVSYLPVFTAPTTLGNSVMYQTGEGLVIDTPGSQDLIFDDKGDGNGLIRLPARMNVFQNDGWGVVGQVVSAHANVDGVAGVFGLRGSGNDGNSFAVFETNVGVLGYNFWGNPYTFGVAGYTYGDYANNGGVFGADHTGAIWGALGYRDNSLNWWGVYTEDNARVGGFTMPTGAGDGRVLTSDANGNAAWQTPQAEIMAYHNEGATTTILSTVTQYGTAQVTLVVPGPGFITVTSNVWLKINHTAGTSDIVYLSNGTSPTTMGNVYTWVAEEIPASQPTASDIDLTRCAVSTFPVTAAGSFTYYLVGQMASGQDANDWFWYAQTTGIYHPAALTTVQQAIDAQEQLREKTEEMYR